MKNQYIIFFLILIFLIFFIGLFYIDIPSPSKLIKETYEMEIK